MTPQTAYHRWRTAPERDPEPELPMGDDYDWEADALGSYHDAISEIRRQGLLEGKYEPQNDEERRMVEEARK